MITQLSSLNALAFSGDKTQDFLQGQLTCDMRPLNQHGDYSLAACCDHRGRMVANFWVMKWHNDFIFILPISMREIVKNHLQKYAVFSKVLISEKDFFVFESDKKSDAPCITMPNPNRHLLISEKNIVENETINHDENVFKKNNIHDLFCILYPSTSLLFTPHMIGLEKFNGVSFNKGCYTGQEIVARTEYLGKNKRQLIATTITSDQAREIGSTITDQDQKEGVLVEIASLEKNNFLILFVH